MTEIGAVETYGAVRTYSRPPARAATYDGDVDRAGEARGPKPPEPSGSVVAQDRTGSADEERGQFQRERRGDRMTDQEHARMHSVQPPAGDPPSLGPPLLRPVRSLVRNYVGNPYHLEVFPLDRVRDGAAQHADMHMLAQPLTNGKYCAMMKIDERPD